MDNEIKTSDILINHSKIPYVYIKYTHIILDFINNYFVYDKNHYKYFLNTNILTILPVYGGEINKYFKFINLFPNIKQIIFDLRFISPFETDSLLTIYWKLHLSKIINIMNTNYLINNEITLKLIYWNAYDKGSFASIEDYIYIEDYNYTITNLQIHDSININIIDIFNKLINLQKLKLVNSFINDDFVLKTKLSNINKISFNSSFYKVFPNYIYFIDKLKKLKLHKMNLTHIDEYIINLQQLEILVLSNNYITHVPDFIFKMTSITSLDLRNNKINRIDINTFNTTLGYLDLHSNKLNNNFLKDIWQIANLNKLIISYNCDINYLPYHFFTLKKLKELDILGTSIIHIPRNIINFQNIEKLSITYLNRLPKYLIYLKNIKQINIYIFNSYSKKLWIIDNKICNTSLYHTLSIYRKRYSENRPC
jgi:hypothetical protein